MLFFELLQIAIGNRDRFSQTPTVEEWRELFSLSQKQAMVGIAFRGVEQLPEEQRPPKTLLMQWYMATERIKSMNADLSRKALAVTNKFLEEGFPSVILKGQGIAQLYIVNGRKTTVNGIQSTVDSQREVPQEATQATINTFQVGELSNLNSQLSISEYRTPGDIDIWLQGGRKDVLDYVRRHVPGCNPVYHHVDFPVVDGLDIEVHFTPAWMNSPVTNRRLQRFFDECLTINKNYIGGRYSEIPVPSTAFNRVYILVHIYRHLFAEGIGLRQLLDYYFVLSQGFTMIEREATMCTLRSLKMQRFAAAMMWVLQEVFGMGNRYLLTTPDEKEGRFLLGEMMLAGNFGKYDERLQYEQGESGLHWGLRKVVRNFRFVSSYPSEVIWSPLFKLWHYFWRRTL